LVSVVCTGVRACSLPLRFMPYLSLAVNDPDLSVKKACADALLAAVHRLRGEHLKRMSVLAESAAQLSNSGDKSGSGSGGRSGGVGGNMDASLALDATLNGSMMLDHEGHHRNGQVMSDEAAALETQRRCLNTTLMPEYAVPYAIHLLTHHPDFPEDSSDTQRVKTVERHLKALLEPLIVSLGAEADNVSFLLQMFDMVMQHEDALDGDADRVLLLCSVGKKCLKKMIKNPENVKPYPGHIYLPVALYRQRETSSRVTPASVDGGEDENLSGNYNSSKRSKKAPPAAKQPTGRKSSSASGTASNRARKHVGESWEASTLLPLDSPSAAHSPFEEPSWGSPIAPASATTVVSRATAKTTTGGRRNSKAGGAINNVSSGSGKRKKSVAKNSSKRASVSDSDLSSSDESDHSYQSNGGRKRGSRTHADHDDDEGPPEMEELLDVRPAPSSTKLSSPNASRRAPPRAANSSMEYLVKWSGRGVESSTWEPAASVSDRTLVADFERRNRQINDAAAATAATAAAGLGSSGDNDDREEEEDSQSTSKSPPSGQKRGSSSSSSTTSSRERRAAAAATAGRNNSKANQKAKIQSPAAKATSSSRAAKVVEPETAGASMLSDDDDDGTTSSSAVSQGMSQDLGVDENAPPAASAKAARSANKSNQKGLSVSNSASANRKNNSSTRSSPSKSPSSFSSSSKRALTSKAAVAAAQAPAAHSSGSKRRTTFSASPQVVKAPAAEAAVSESDDEEIVTLSRRRRRPAAASAN